MESTATGGSDPGGVAKKAYQARRQGNIANWVSADRMDGSLFSRNALFLARLHLKTAPARHTYMSTLSTLQYYMRVEPAFVSRESHCQPRSSARSYMIVTGSLNRALIPFWIW
jgi:hypothetical protein